MDKYALFIDVFDKSEIIDSFVYSLDSLNPITFPNKLPYQGMKLFIAGSLENGFEFSPDGYEIWVRFSHNKEGIWKPYLVDREYKFVFTVALKQEYEIFNENVYDNVDEFERIKNFKKKEM